eukprot:Gb_13806 [translate_table: standard]
MRRPLVLYSVRDERIVREAIRMPPLKKCECSDRKWFVGFGPGIRYARHRPQMERYHLAPWGGYQGSLRRSGPYFFGITSQ